MSLQSPRFAGNTRLENAAENSPAIRAGAVGDHVAVVQKAFIDLGYSMPVSVRKAGKPDGIFGNETWSVVYKFQTDQKLDRDGIVGRQTMTKLDELFRVTPPPKPTVSFNYVVPGIFDVLAQPTGMTCWATVGTMMMSWRDQVCRTIHVAMGIAGAKWQKMFDEGKGLPAADHGPFALGIGTVYEGLACYSAEGWLSMLMAFGPLAVVTANPYHARIMVGMRDGGGAASPGSSGGGVTDLFVELIDPDGGRRYYQDFLSFTRDFEDVANSPRYQLWHYLPGAQGRPSF